MQLTIENFDVKIPGSNVSKRISGTLYFHHTSGLQIEKVTKVDGKKVYDNNILKNIPSHESLKKHLEQNKQN